MRLNDWKLVVVLCGSLIVSACSSTPDDPYADPRDPYENFNRDMWDFNEALDENIVRPAAVGYSKIPQPIRSGMYNMVRNLDEVANTVNHGLQGEFGNAGSSIGRFLINSTVGLLGFFDVASELGLAEHDEDFGEVLATWGVPDGPFIMLPGIGPTVPIDRGGDIVDGTYFPLDNITSPWNIVRVAIKGLETRVRLMDQEQVLENSLDPYSFVKEAYLQRWRSKVYNGNPPPEPVDEFDDFDDFDEFDDESFDDVDAPANNDDGGAEAAAVNTTNPNI